MRNVNVCKRSAVKIISFAGALLIILLSFLIINGVKVERYRKEVENGYARAVNGLAESVSAMEIELNKCICSGSERGFDETAAKLWVFSQQAKLHAEELPIDPISAANIERFFEQTGNYVMSAEAETLSDVQYDELISLSENAGRLRIALEELISDAAESGSWSEECERLRLRDTADMEENKRVKNDLIFEEYPSLIYDGPFSDHIFEREPELMKNKHEISQEQAARTAKKILSEEPFFVGESKGKIEEYIFTGADGVAEIAITKRGGFVSYMINHRTQGDIRITAEQAEERARDFMESLGYEDFVKLQHNIYECNYVVSFAPSLDNIILYPNQIKIEVSLDCGDILAIDARDYIMNHGEQCILSAKKTRFQAEECISDMLNVKECRLVQIQSDALEKILCYEFLCERWDGGEAMVYINANNLSEEKIFLITRSDDGVFAI